MDKVRLGCVKYLNTLPLIEGLASWRDAEIVPAVPSRLIDMLRDGEVDVALASVIDAARHSASDGVVMLSAGMIGCDGPTLTVRLFSRVPIPQVRRVCVDTDSHTSAALMQVVMHRKFGVRIEVTDFDAREHVVIGENRANTSAAEWPETVLLIGDKVVTDAPPANLYPHQLDLGQAWKEMTGLPFVYAVWMCRAGEENSVKVRTAAAALDRQRRHNATRLDWIVAGRAHERHWPTDLASKYVGTLLKYDVGEPEREAVAKFLQWAGELELCGSSAGRWADEPESCPACPN